MKKKVSPENNCENCFRKKYCGKPCSARKYLVNYSLNGFAKGLSTGLDTMNEEVIR